MNVRMFSVGIIAVAAILAPLSLTPARAQSTPGSASALAGGGTLSDSEGRQGSWSVDAVAAGSGLTGTLVVQLAGRTMRLDPGQARAYRENGRCYIRGERGRDRIELAGSCDAKPFSGVMRGFLDGEGAISGTFTGSLAAAGASRRPDAPAPAPAPTPVSRPARIPPPAAQRPVSVNPNSGPFSGAGTLATSDGESGAWRVRGVLSAGMIKGTLDVDVAGRTMTVDLDQGHAYFENGFCVLKGVAGRNRFQLRGRCDREPYSGTINGYYDKVGEVNGSFTGTLKWGAAGSRPPAAGVLPAGKLTCSYMERMGGVVAGDIGTREIRPSALGTLTLSPSGTYVARNGSGRFVREGQAIRLTSGPWAGALGRLMPDNSGSPAVYFEREDNRRADGSYIVDPWRTFCTTSR
ncbi:hypothetical protein [Sphingomonas sp.]|uniref:hypothetical protein n=1 Tax=Sphingomonas sp. TaxID=28214 RepID=UPI001EB8225C|nr:hypothetical protein [Sphingomonas sp.]MBX3595753.1 hypothetical protein [Sphingomonas sp.]